MFENFDGIPDFSNTAINSGRGTLGYALAMSAKTQVKGSFSGLNLALTASSMQRVSTKTGPRTECFDLNPYCSLTMRERVGFSVTCEPFCCNFGNNSQTKSDEHDETLILWETADLFLCTACRPQCLQPPVPIACIPTLRAFESRIRQRSATW